MKLNVSVKIKGLNTAVKVLSDKFLIAMGKAQKRITHQNAAILIKHMFKKGAYATGKSVDTVRSRYLPRAGSKFVVITGFHDMKTKDDIFYVEHGRGPGDPPPYRKILAWAVAVGIDLDVQRTKNKKSKKAYSNTVFKIMHKIAQEGTEGKFFMEGARKEIKQRATATVRKELMKFNGNKNTKSK